MDEDKRDHCTAVRFPTSESDQRNLEEDYIIRTRDYHGR